jgi:hypothetical protein
MNHALAHGALYLGAQTTHWKDLSGEFDILVRLAGLYGDRLWDSSSLWTAQDGLNRGSKNVYPDSAL